MAISYDASQRLILQQAAARGEPLRCPVCDIAVTSQPVNPRPEISYVRHRLWLLCPHCRRSASIDLPHKP
jgi:hypothetical protein